MMVFLDHLMVCPVCVCIIYALRKNYPSEEAAVRAVPLLFKKGSKAVTAPWCHGIVVRGRNLPGEDHLVLCAGSG